LCFCQKLKKQYFRICDILGPPPTERPKERIGEVFNIKEDGFNTVTGDVHLNFKPIAWVATLG